jgi:hypothetical protein
MSFWKCADGTVIYVLWNPRNLPSTDRIYDRLKQ